MPQITQVYKSTGTSGRVTYAQNATQLATGPGTLVIYYKPLTIDGSLDYAYSETLDGYALRLMLDQAFINFGLGSAATTSYNNLNPARKSDSSTAWVANQWAHVATTWDGTSNGLGIELYKADDGQAMALLAAANFWNGLTNVRIADGTGMHLFNRGNDARGAMGVLAYAARWDRVLSLAELEQVRTQGPLSVPTGLLACIANGQDYGPHASIENFRANVTDSSAGGDMPPIIELGGASTTPVQSDVVLQSTGAANVSRDVVLQSSGTASATTTTILTDYAGATANASLSTVTNGSTNNPNIFIVPRSPEDTTFQHYAFGLADVANKTLAIEIDYTEDDAAGILGTYDGPWWTSNLNDWQSWQKVPSYSYNGTTKRKTYTISGHGAANTIYIATTPQANQPQIKNWIDYLSANYPTLIHDDLPSTANDAEAFVLGRAYKAIDENARQITNQPYYGFRIGNDALGVQAPLAKKRVILNAGTHAGEPHGLYQLQGFVTELLTGVNSTALLTDFEFYVYPFINPNGNYLGFRRYSPDYLGTQLDMNRKFADSNIENQDCVAWRGIWDADHGVNYDHVVFGLDFHDAFSTDPTTHYFIDDTTPNIAAIETIINATHAGRTSLRGNTIGTTYYYWQRTKNVLNVTPEAADERTNMAGFKAIGASYATAIKNLNDAGHLPTKRATRFGSRVPLSFDVDLSGFTNTGTRNWARITGPTPSGNTGTDRAHAGTHYLYVENDGAGASDTFIIERAVDFSTLEAVQFQFNRRYCYTSQLFFECWNGSAWVQKWSHTVNQLTSYAWHPAHIDVSDLVNTDGKIRFRQIYFGGWNSQNDTGIDSVVLIQSGITAVQADCAIRVSGVASIASNVGLQVSGLAAVQRDAQARISGLGSASQTTQIRLSAVAGVSQTAVLQSSGASALSPVFANSEIRLSGRAAIQRDLIARINGLSSANQTTQIRSSSFGSAVRSLDLLISGESALSSVFGNVEIRSTGVGSVGKNIELRSNGLIAVSRDLVARISSGDSVAADLALRINGVGSASNSVALWASAGGTITKDLGVRFSGAGSGELVSRNRRVIYKEQRSIVIQ